MKPEVRTNEELAEEIADLRSRLEEASETLHAIGIGEVDAVLVHGPQGDQLFTLKGADAPYRVLIEEMNQGAVTLSADGSILYCNRRFADLLKMPIEEIVGSAFSAFVGPSERAQFGKLLEMGSVESSAGEITLCASDASAVPMQLAMGPLPALSAAAICLVATDISESREKEIRLRKTMADLVRAEKEAEAARAEAERANAAKSEFLAKMSHEIRTPMNGIIGMTDLTLETNLNGGQREYLGMVKISAHSLLGLVNNILDFSKIEAGKLELEEIDFSLRHCIDGGLKPLGIRAAQKGVQFETDIASKLVDLLVGDPTRLRQILINLTDNAIKFTKHGSVRLKVALEEQRGDRVCLHFSIKDTGAGIPPEKQGLIFEAFAQVDGSTTRNYGGTGLGLAIALQLVEQMHGKIWIESTLGVGTTFHFTAWFGVAQAHSIISVTPSVESTGAMSEAPAVDSGRPKPPATTGLRILLAEDNQINRALAAGILEKRGHSLVHATNGQEALEIAGAGKFDLIIMDVQMPEMDGFEATRRIREMEDQTGVSHTPIVAMTAHAMTGDRQRCLAAGMDDYLSKPLEKAALLALIERISAKRILAVNGSDSSLPSIPVPLESKIAPAAAGVEDRFVWLARGASSFVFLIGLCVLAGWFFTSPLLMTVLPGFVAMKANTALAFCFGGLSLFLFTKPFGEANKYLSKLGTLLAGAMALIGLLTLMEYLSGFSLGIDQFLFRDHVVSGAPGRMSPISAFNFGCLGLALFLLRDPKRTVWVHTLTSAAAATSLVAVVGYFYGVTWLYQSGNFIAVALHTAIGFLVLSAGICCATSGHGFMRVLTSNGASGFLVRRYGLAAIILPFLIGWLRLQGEHAGWYSSEVGVAIFASISSSIFAILVWVGAASLRNAERKESLVKEGVRRANVELELHVLERTSELAKANAGLRQQVVERGLAESALQEVMDTSLDVICTFDIEGRFRQVNRACEALWGYRPEELIGRHFLEMVHPDDREKTVNVDRAILDGVAEKGFENRYLRQDGTVVPILWTANWSDDLQLNVCVARDITKRKEMEVELQRAKDAAEAGSQAKSEFLANMSHEIRTPMNGIIGMTELLLESKLDLEQREYLVMAKTSANALLVLINDILDFSKIEAGKLHLETISFSLRGCIATMLKPLGMLADQKGIELTADIPADVPDHLVGDPMRLRQILVNLTDNAIKFTEHGDVAVRVAVESSTNDEHCLLFSVQDTGIGIPVAKQEVIFDAFAQVDGSTTRTYGGTGLGLAIASQLVRQMKGRIWAESEIGRGTTFYFTVRAPVRHTPAPEVRQVDSRRLVDLRALVVDDNAINRRILRDMLANWGMQPTVVASGPAALLEMLGAARDGRPFPLVILDGMMPEMDGFMVAEKIREHAELNGATMMLLSSAMPGGVAARCAELGVAGYLSKPVSQARLLEAILTALGGTFVQAEPMPEIALAVKTAISLHILLAEDNLINRALAGAILERRGHSLVRVANGREAVEAAASESFDLILMDVQMPEMDGFEAARRIRQAELGTGRRTRIAALTAHAMIGDRERCLAAGMDDYLSKPLNKDELLALLERIAAHRLSVACAPGANGANGHRPANQTEPPPRTSVPRGLPIFTREKLLDQLDGDEALMRQVIQLFHELTPKILDDIRGSIARRHFADIASSAHVLLSSLGAFGANDARRITLQLEAHAHGEDLDNVNQTFIALELGIVEIYAALATFVGFSECT